MAKKTRQDRWIVGNEEDSANLWTLSLWTPAFLYEFPKYSGLQPFYHVFEFTRDHFRWFTPEARAQKIGNALLARLMRSPRWFSHLRKDLVEVSNKLYRFSLAVLRTDVRKLSNKELAALFVSHQQITSRVVGCGLVSTLSDFPLEQFSKALMAVLERRAQKQGCARSAAEYFAMLSPLIEESIAQKERKALLRLYRDVERSNLRSGRRLDLRISAHLRKFSWAYYGYGGPVLGIARVRRELAELRKNKVVPSVELARLQKEARAARIGITQAERELKLSPRERVLFHALRDTVFMKMYRKDACSFSFFAMEGAVREVARRAHISFEAAKCLVPGEHARALGIVRTPHPRPSPTKGRGRSSVDRRFLAELPKRVSYVVFSGASRKPAVLVGKRARAYMKKLYREEKIGKISELKGSPACIGKATGAVKIVNVTADMVKMRQGDILVSTATSPDIVPAMKKAGAIVTEMGGITSHASIVSRELGVPCVIGTKIATKVFKDGDRVEVDAERGVVRKL